VRICIIYDGITFRGGFSKIADLYIVPHFTDPIRKYICVITALN